MKQPVSSRLYLDSVLVIALHEQRPDLDRDIIDTTSDHVRSYVARLAEITPELVPDEPGKSADPTSLFEPRKALLWGAYDHATFFLSDDLEAVEQVSYGSGATSQEFLFGSPYLFDGALQSLPEGLQELFGAETQNMLPLLAISRIKLGDHLLATLGGGLRDAVACQIYRNAKDAEKVFGCRVVPIILRSWSWPDLVVILQADDPRALTTVITSTEHLTVDEVIHAGSSYRALLRSAMRHPIPRQLLKIWTQGREGVLLGENSLGKKLESLPFVGKCDVVVSEQSQLGIPLNGWKKFGRSYLGEDQELLFKVMTCAFEPQYSSAFIEQIREGQKFEFADKLAKSYNRIDQDFGDHEMFQARISILARPGHIAMAERFAQVIVDKVGAKHLAIRKSCGGNGVRLILSLAVPPTPEGFFFLFCLSHSFRVCASVHQHLLDVSTTLDWYQPSGDVDESKVDLTGTPRGYSLLQLRASDQTSMLRHFRTLSAGVGRVQGLALRALGNAVEQASSRPELFGAIMELSDVTQAMDQDLVHGRDDISLALAEQIEKVMPYAQKAYQQRLQFSPILSGVPPLNGQLPYGINQIVRTIDGLSTILTATSLLPFDEDQGRGQFGRSYRKLIVIFEADAAIAVRHMHDFGILQLSLLQALTPLSLTALFHELGHFLIRRWCWHNRVPSSDPLNLEGMHEWGEELRNWFVLRKNLTVQIHQRFLQIGQSSFELAEGQSKGASAQRHWHDRVHDFLEDVFAHAVWRRVGCGRSFELFQCQFLAVQAMGIRCKASLSEPLVALDAWALSAIHLAIQRALSEADESVEGGFALFGDWLTGENVDAWWRDHLQQILPYASGELLCAIARISRQESPPEEVLLSRVYTWLPAFWSLASDTTEAYAYRRQLEQFFSSVGTLEEAMAAHERILRGWTTYREISTKIMHGEPVGWNLPWEFLVSQNGLPGPGALLWMRSILTAVTEHFLATHQRNPGSTRSIRRDRQLKLVKPEDDALRGLYPDFIGGLFIAGKKERQEYLRVRLAAIESLAELASRTQAEAIRIRFLRRRRYKRSPLGSDRKTRLRVNGIPRSVVVRDISAGGLGLELNPLSVVVRTILVSEPELGLSGGRRFDVSFQIEVETFDGKLLKCRAAWIKAEGMKIRVGLALVSPQEQAGQSEAVVPQMEKLWLKLEDVP